MKKSVRLHQSAAGRSPVKEFLDRLSDQARGRVEADIDFLETEPGLGIGAPTYKHLRGAIWEIRTPTREGAIRVLFAVDGGFAVLLVGLKKKRQKLDPGDLEVAKHRLEDYFRRKVNEP